MEDIPLFILTMLFLMGFISVMVVFGSMPEVTAAIQRRLVRWIDGEKGE